MKTKKTDVLLQGKYYKILKTKNHETKKSIRQTLNQGEPKI